MQAGEDDEDFEVVEDDSPPGGGIDADWGGDESAGLPRARTTSDPRHRKSADRAWLTKALAALLFLDLVGAWFMLAYVGEDQIARAESFIGLTFPALTGLVGAATGFYYGTRDD